MEFKTMKLRCEILSPVHIGTGEEIPAYEYIIIDNYLIKLNLDKVLYLLSNKDMDKFNQYNEAGDYIGLRKFLVEIYREKEIQDTAIEYKIPVTNDIQKKYEENIDNPENQLLIKMQFRNELSKQPIIPGSSIKGAIRTAILNKLSENFERLPKNSKGAEGVLLNAFDDKKKRFNVEGDPFKYLKVPDVSLPSDSTYICAVNNAIKNKQGNLIFNDIQMIHEVFYSHLTGNSITFDLEIKLGNMRVGREIIDEEFIINSCIKYYRNKLEKIDASYFSSTPILNQINTLINSVNYDNDEFLLRIGRFSGVDSITLDKHRIVKPAKSRNLCDGKYPMGWIKCTKIN